MKLRIPRPSCLFKKLKWKIYGQTEYDYDKEDVVDMMWPNIFFICSSCGKHINGFGAVNDPNRFKCCANPKIDRKYFKEVMSKIPRYVVENATFIEISH